MSYYIYVVGQVDGPVKIGITQNVHTRLKTLRCATPFPIEMLHAYGIKDDPTSLEVAIHHELQDRRLNGEWFSVGAETARQVVENVANAKVIPFSRTAIKRRNWKPLPKTINTAKGGRPRKADALMAVTLRLHPDVVAAFKAGGDDWRSRMAEALERAC